MNKILEKLHQLALNRLATRLKHLRGRHDQLDHAWNRGMGRGGGGVGLAPNQMGPVVSQDFYRKRKVELMDQRRQGTITRAEMRRQLDELQGKIPENNVVQPTTQSTINQTNITQQIQKFQEQRNSERLPNGFNIEPYKSEMERVVGGMSGVQKLNINKNQYYYRNTPLYYGKVDEKLLVQFFIDLSPSHHLWSLIRGPLKGLAADNIASALGLPLAPVAQETNEGFIITNGMPLISEVENLTKDEYIALAQKEYNENPTEENYLRLVQIIEPLAIMDLLMGQGDGHLGNVAIVQNPNQSLYNSEYILTSVDYDLSGTNRMFSFAVKILKNALSDRFQFQGSARLLTPQMREILTHFSQNVQWHPSIPELAQQQILDRVQAILNADATTQNPANLFLADDPNYDESFTAPFLTPSDTIMADLLLVEVVENEKLLRDVENQVININNLTERFSEEELFRIENIMGITVSNLDFSLQSLRKRMIELMNALLQNNPVDEQIAIHDEVLSLQNTIRQNIQLFNNAFFVSDIMQRSNLSSEAYVSNMTNNFFPRYNLSSVSDGFAYLHRIDYQLLSNPATFENATGYNSVNQQTTYELAQNRAKQSIESMIQFAYSFAQLNGNMPELMQLLSQFNVSNPKSFIYHRSDYYKLFADQMKQFIDDNFSDVPIQYDTLNEQNNLATNTTADQVADTINTTADQVADTIFQKLSQLFGFLRK